MIAPNPHVIASRNDSENTETCRLRAIARHPDHVQLGAGAADADHVGRAKHRLTCHASFVHERPVTAEVLEPYFTVPESKLEVEPREAAVAAVDDDRPAAV